MATRKQRAAHGLTEDAVIFEEHREAFNDLFSTFLNHLLPVGPLETALVHQIVMAQWRLARCRKLETGFFSLSYDDHRPDLEADHPDFDPKRHWPTSSAAAPRPSTPSAATRARTERAFFRALHELQRLQAARERPTPAPGQNKFCRTKPIQPQPLAAKRLTAQ